MQAALFDLPVRAPSQLDPDIDANRVQARYELNRALDFGNDADLAAWARRWGPGFIEADDVNEIARLEDRIGELEAESDAPIDTDDARAELDEVKACIQTALEDLDVDTSPDAVAQLKDGLTYIEKTRAELARL